MNTTSNTTLPYPVLFWNCTGENPIFHSFTLLRQKVDRLRFNPPSILVPDNIQLSMPQFFGDYSAHSDRKTNYANFLAPGCTNATLYATRFSWTPHLWRHLKPLYWLDKADVFRSFLTHFKKNCLYLVKFLLTDWLTHLLTNAFRQA